ncbi:MAG: dTDP-4-dehydrorhamnose 3,5-epimerase [Nitratireductor sp.]|nr:dTDP-4-dehydrorhamnose 3,5-epimerase [Nitratireductor sp.]
MELDLPGVYEIVPQKHEDDRGLFMEVFRESDFARQGLPSSWVQDNQSLSRQPGTLRGLHYQSPPMAQDKLVRVTKGSILDVAVDIRKGSPTYGHWIGIVISAEKFNQVLVPKGFAHGFVTLEPDTEVQYKVSAYYSPEHDRTISHDDPDIRIDWNLDGNAPILSDKDAHAPRLGEQDTGFVYQGALTEADT